jgi:hypothetical protein
MTKEQLMKKCSKATIVLRNDINHILEILQKRRVTRGILTILGRDTIGKMAISTTYTDKK